MLRPACTCTVCGERFVLRQWFPYLVNLCVSLCFIGVVISYSTLPVLEKVVHKAGTKLKQVEMLLFHSSAIVLHCVFGHDLLLSQCLPSPRYTNGYWVNFKLGLALQLTGIPFLYGSGGGGRGGRVKKTSYQLILQELNKVW